LPRTRDAQEPVTIYDVRPGRRGAAFLPPPEAEVTAAWRALAEVWVPSRFNVSVDLPAGRRAVYNTFTSALTVVNRGFWRRHFARNVRLPRSGEAPSETLRLLAAKGFLVPRGLDEIARVRLKYQADRHEQDGFTVDLLPTLAFNLRCSYCFEGRDRKSVV
jgi:hypothetical protein